MATAQATAFHRRPNALRLGLCCQFAREPIKFRATTATALLRLPRPAQLARLADLCRANAEALLASLEFCASHGIGAFRIVSQILPVKTHPAAGYEMNDLPGGADIIARFIECGRFARSNDLRLSFHPDQFVVLNSPNPHTLAHSLAELNYQAEVVEWVGADTINLHSGAYGDKAAALDALRRDIERLPGPVRSRLTLYRQHLGFLLAPQTNWLAAALFCSSSWASWFSWWRPGWKARPSGQACCGRPCSDSSPMPPTT